MLENIRYRIDNLFARGTRALLAVLGGTVLFLILVLTTVMVVVQVRPGPDAGLLDTLWTVFVYTFDPSGVPYSDGTWAYRLIMLCASLGGIFVLSLLVGILANGFADAVQTLRKGKSIVVESGHTLILGWGDQIFSMIHELLVANANVKRACIVILAEKDKVEMEDELRARIGPTGSTRIVCRHGSPIDIADLAIVRPTAAKSVIVLSDQATSGEQRDARTIKTLLALKQLFGTTTSTTVVASMHDESNLRVAELAAPAGACIIPNEIMISQIITQTCRQPGLSMVYTELLDFDGDELYITAVEETIGRTFEDVMLMFETSAVVGVRYASGQLKVNPPMQTVLSAGDAIIAISADDDTIITRRQQGLSDLHINADAISPSAALPPSPERILVLGWNERGRFIVRELDQYVRAGTTVHVHDAVDRSADIDAIRRVVKNMSLTTGRGSTTAREDLDALNVLAYDSVIVLADTGIGVQEADARTLMTLIHLRDMTSGTSVNIVTEMLDERNRSLAATDRIGDFIISNTIMSLLLTQIAETPDLHAVFRDLFDADGSELYLKPSRTYVLNDRDVTWATVVKAAGLRGEIAIGTKSLVDGEWRVALNIPKSSMCRFREGDMVIVVAED